VPNVQSKGRGNSAPAAAAPGPVIPFTRAAREKSFIAFDTGNITAVAAAAVQVAPIQLPAAGFLKYVEIVVTGVTAGNAAAVTFAADAPFNVLNYASLTNSAGDTIITPMTGYQLMLINKYGALGVEPPFGDPRGDNQYSVTTGAGATGGSFTFMLRIPLEFDPRDAYGAVPNLASNKAYNLQFIISATNSVYGTAPTTAPLVRIQGTSFFWSQPATQTPFGTGQATSPDSDGSVSMWRLQTAPVTSGDRYVTLTNVGNVIRAWIFVLRNSSSVRVAANADWPAVSQLVLNNDVLLHLPLVNWVNGVAQNYGYVFGAVEAARGLDNGVFPLYHFIDQKGNVKVDGSRDQLLPTLDATLVQFHATTFGATANTLEIISNEIKPVSAASLYSLNLT
jgi:hypothetical protein